MSLDKALQHLQWALAFLFLAGCAKVVVAILKLIEVSREKL